ncbi:MAG: hypothetical protein ORN49_05990 [Rhodobacteraceae bacterium]|nr:hypothetical protein [Paracoccaceae bacterium]
MQLKKVMDSYLADMPDCLFAAYVDMASGLVLCSAGRKSVSQEILDRLASVASNLFLGNGLSEWGRLTGATDMDRATVFAGVHLYFYHRMDRFPDHALCFVCRRSADTHEVRSHAMAARKEVALAL